MQLGIGRRLVGLIVVSRVCPMSTQGPTAAVSLDSGIRIQERSGMFPEDKHLDEISDFPKKRHNLLFRLHAILPTLRKRLRSMSYRHIAVPRGNPLLPLRRKTLVDIEREGGTGCCQHGFLDLKNRVPSQKGLTVRPR